MAGEGWYVAAAAPMGGPVLNLTPLFSVIVPTYERPSLLSRCLQSLAALDFPRAEFGVIVVDDGGDVDLTAVTTPIAELINIQLVRQANAGPAAARNHGAALASGRYLAFIDDDCRADPGWLRALQAQTAATPHVLIGGRVVNGLVDNPFAAASQALIDYLYEYARERPSSGVRFFTSNNLAVAADAFAARGGFDAAMPLAAGEDREFCDRWLSSGNGLAFAAAAVVTHFHDLTIGSFWRQHFNYGRGAYQYHRLRAERRETTLKVEPIRFYWNLLRCPFSRGNGRAAWQQAALLFVSQIANFAGFLTERVKPKKL